MAQCGGIRRRTVRDCTRLYGAVSRLGNMEGNTIGFAPLGVGIAPHGGFVQARGELDSTGLVFRYRGIVRSSYLRPPRSAFDARESRVNTLDRKFARNPVNTAKVLSRGAGITPMSFGKLMSRRSARKGVNRNWRLRTRLVIGGSFHS